MEEFEIAGPIFSPLTLDFQEKIEKRLTVGSTSESSADDSSAFSSSISIVTRFRFRGVAIVESHESSHESEMITSAGFVLFTGEF